MSINTFREDIRDVLQVHAGKVNPRLLGVQQRRFTKFIRHPNYDKRNTGYYFDVALLILNEVCISYKEDLLPVIFFPSLRNLFLMRAHKKFVYQQNQYHHQKLSIIHTLKGV